MPGGNTSAPPLDGQPSPKSPQGQWSAVLAGFLGWTMDAFDFFLVVLCNAEIGREFKRSEAEIGLSLVLALAFRPLGALIFGLLADRYGRRKPLMINLVFYSTIEVLTGLAPNYSTFLVLRALFGIGMGGEWGVGASLAMEKVPPRWRGVLSGLLQEGYALGYLLAAACYGIFYPLWGWRPLFFLGGLPALLALYVRYGVRESEVWEQTRSPDWASLRRSIFANWKLFIYLVALMAAMNFTSHGTQDFYPSFLKEDHHLKDQPHMVSWITIIMQVGAIIGGVSFGLFSDRIGRRSAMVIAFLLAIIIIPLWAFPPSLVWLAVGAFLFQFMVQGAWGIVPAHITELSPDNVRGFLPGFAYQCGVLIASSVDWINPVLTKQIGRPNAMMLMAVEIFGAAGVIVMLGRERAGITFGKDALTPAAAPGPGGLPVILGATE